MYTNQISLEKYCTQISPIFYVVPYETHRNSEKGRARVASAAQGDFLDAIDLAVDFYWQTRKPFG